MPQHDVEVVDLEICGGAAAEGAGGGADCGDEAQGDAPAQVPGEAPGLLLPPGGADDKDGNESVASSKTLAKRQVRTPPHLKLLLPCDKSGRPIGSLYETNFMKRYTALYPGAKAITARIGYNASSSFSVPHSEKRTREAALRDVQLCVAQSTVQISFFFCTESPSQNDSTLRVE